MALFPLPVKAEMSDRFKMPARVLQFGDGYEQTGLAGLNRQQTIWDIEVIIASAAQDELFNAFLLEHGQHKSFTWRSPRDTTLQLYRITGDVSSTRRNGGGSKPVFFSRRMQFKSTNVESVFQPIPYVLDLDFNLLIPFDRTGKSVILNGEYTRSNVAYNSSFSGVFNGTNSWLFAPPSPDWNINSPKLTITCIINTSAMPTGTFYPSVSNLVHHGSANLAFGWALILEKDHINFSNNDVYVARGLHGMATGQFYQVKYVRNAIGLNVTHQLFINNSQVADVVNNTTMNFNSTRGLSVGCEEYGAGAFYNGLINSMKITKD